MIFKKQSKTGVDSWEQKATRRTKLIKVLEKKVRRLLKSRHNWKEKAKRYKQHYDQSQAKIKELERELKKNDV